MKEDKNSDSNSSAKTLDRREFLATSILTGAFALAVQPIQAQTRIVTDGKNLIEGEVKISSPTARFRLIERCPTRKTKNFRLCW